MFNSRIKNVLGKKTIVGLLGLTLTISAVMIPHQGYSADQTMATVTKKEAETPAVDLSKRTFNNVNALDLIKSPDKFMEKDVVFTGTFNRFSDLGLDYPKALRETKDYVAMLILRPDVGSRTIPMSELKLFFPRKQSAEVLELDTGDEVEIKGNVFSNALGDPWIDVLAVKIMTKAPKKDAHQSSEGAAIGD